MKIRKKYYPYQLAVVVIAGLSKHSSQWVAVGVRHIFVQSQFRLVVVLREIVAHWHPNHPSSYCAVLVLPSSLLNKLDIQSTYLALHMSVLR
jgi:hypothetical protein